MQLFKDEDGNITKIQFEENDIFMDMLNVKDLLRDMPDTKFYNTQICLPDTKSKYKIFNLGIVDIPEKVGARKRDERFSNCVIISHSNDLFFDDCDLTDFRMNQVQSFPNQKIFYIGNSRDSIFPQSTIIYTQPISSNNKHKSLLEFFLDYNNNNGSSLVTVHANYNGLWQNITFI